MKRTAIAWIVIGFVIGLNACGPSGPYRSQKQVYRDTEIEVDIMTQFQQNNGLSNVTAISNRGEVTLTGEVSDPELSKKAEELANSVSKVRSVTNRITVNSKPVPQ